MIQRIDFYVSFPLVTIRIDDDMNILVFLWCYTQDGSMTQSRKFGFEMFFPQVDCIIMRVRYFICMRKGVARSSGCNLSLPPKVATVKEP